MKILKILGVVIIVLIILYIVGFFNFYTVGSGFRMPSSEPIEKKSCVGKNIVIYDQRPVDGGAKFFCVGFVKTTISQRK